MKVKFVAYYRVSTQQQGRSGLGLEAQKRAVVDFLDGNGWELVAGFKEVESGKRTENRPELAQALEACRKQKAVLIIAKLDRLARNVHFISGLIESGVDFKAVDMPEANKTMIQMFAVMSEWERDQISKRTKEALAVAKKRGVKLGNPEPMKALAAGFKVRTESADRYLKNLLPIIESIKKTGVTSLNGIARTLTARGMKTARGSVRWTAKGVSQYLQRAERRGLKV